MVDIKKFQLLKYPDFGGLSANDFTGNRALDKAHQGKTAKDIFDRFPPIPKWIEENPAILLDLAHYRHMFLKDMGPLTNEYWENASEVNRKRAINDRAEDTRHWFQSQEKMIIHNMDMRLVLNRAHYFKVLGKNMRDHTLGLLTVSLIRYQHSMEDLKIRFAKHKEDVVHMLQESRDDHKAAIQKDISKNTQREDHIYAQLMENKESWEYINTIIGLKAQQLATVYEKVTLIDIGVDRWRAKTSQEIVRINKMAMAKKTG